MNGLKKTGAILLLSGLLQFASLSTAFCSDGEYRITAEQLTMLESELTALEENNSKQLNLLEESEADLKTANTELTALKEELRLANAELQRLRYLLTQLKAESANADASLKIANEELKSVCESVQKLEKQKSRIEKQRDFWEGISAVLGIWRIFG